MRPVRTPADLENLEELFAACTLADGHRPIGEHKYLSLMSRRPTSTVSFVGEDGGRIVSFLHLSENRLPGGWTFESAVHPSYRTDEHLVGVARSAIDEAVRRGGRTLRTWVFNATWPASLSVLGFEPERELRQLRTRLPVAEPNYPPGIRRDTFRPGQDDQRWLEVNNEAFSGHPENGSWSIDILTDRMSQPWWDPTGVIMAWDGRDLVGFCWTKDHGDGLGEIYIIAVRPTARRRGLGRSLTLDGLNSLFDRGCRTGMLYVDAGNDGAIRMYEGMDFTLHHIDQSMIVGLGAFS